VEGFLLWSAVGRSSGDSGSAVGRQRALGGVGAALALARGALHRSADPPLAGPIAF